MMIYRSLVVGLLVAVALLLTEQGVVLERIAGRGRVAVVDVDGRAIGAARAVRDPRGWPGDSPATTVHISRRGAGDDPLAALGLGPDEIPLAIDDRLIPGSWHAAVRDRWRQAPPGSYFELWVRTPDVLRRVLVLVTT